MKTQFKKIKTLAVMLVLFVFASYKTSAQLQYTYYMTAYGGQYYVCLTFTVDGKVTFQEYDSDNKKWFVGTVNSHSGFQDLTEKNLTANVTKFNGTKVKCVFTAASATVTEDGSSPYTYSLNEKKGTMPVTAKPKPARGKWMWKLSSGSNEYIVYFERSSDVIYGKMFTSVDNTWRDLGIMDSSGSLDDGNYYCKCKDKDGVVYEMWMKPNKTLEVKYPNGSKFTFQYSNGGQG
jgi:hypothetical protein